MRVRESDRITRDYTTHRDPIMPGASMRFGEEKKQSRSSAKSVVIGAEVGLNGIGEQEP